MPRSKRTLQEPDPIWSRESPARPEWFWFYG